MEIIELNQKPGIKENVKLEGTVLQFEKLLTELRTKELPDGITASINEDIENLNSISGSGEEFRKLVKKKQAGIIKLLEKELKLVPKKYYTSLWLAPGMGAFGIPIGAAIGASLGNMAFLGLGIPIGLAIGIAIGTGMDKKAFNEGRQLDLEIK